MPEDQATQRLAEILGRIKQLASADLEPPQFFANFLQLAVAATGSRGGAVWLTRTDQGPQCYCHIEIELCQVSQSDHQKRLVLEAVGQTVIQQRPMVIPPAAIDEGQTADQAAGDTGVEGGPVGSNQCPFPLFFMPLRAANQVAMVLQLIGAQTLTAHDYRVVVGLLGQIAEAAQTYLAQRRASVLEDDRKSLARLLQYAEGVHNSLDPEKVIYQLANQGRDVIGCSRVVVWIDPKVKRHLVAVSGVDKPDRRAVLLQSLAKLSQHCLEIKKTIIAAREQLVELPEEEKLTILLKDYFNISKLDQIFLQPIRHNERDLGVLIAEGFDKQSGVNLAGIISAISKHGAIALSNAVEMASVPLMRPLGRLQKIKSDPKRKRKWITIAAVILAALVVGALMPWTIKIDCTCRLTPRQRRIIDAPLDGVQIVRIVRPSGRVVAGEIIAELDDAELKAKLGALRARHAQEKVKLDQAPSGSTEKKYYDLEGQRLLHEIDLINLQIDKCKVRAPIDGTILTPQLERRAGITVTRGDLICEMANLSEWELVLEVPQEEIGWVRRGLTDEDAAAPAQFFLAAYPEYKLNVTVSGLDQISEMARIGEEGNIFEIRVPVPREQLQVIMAGLGDGSEGRAKIATVSRPLGYVLLRKVIRFFRVTLF